MGDSITNVEQGGFVIKSFDKHSLNVTIILYRSRHTPVLSVIKVLPGVQKKSKFCEKAKD